MKKWLVVIMVVFSCAQGNEVKRDRFFLQGNEALQSREFDQAIDFYDRAIELDSSFARAFNNRGVAKVEDDRPLEAIQDYNMAISIDSLYYEAIFNRAYAYERSGRIEKALEDVQTVKQAFPDSSYVFFYQGLLQSRLKGYDRAVSSFVKALQLDSANQEAMINLATLYYFKNELDTAEVLLKEILKKYPAEANALNTLSQIYLARKEYQKALITINQALDLVPSEPYFLNNRGLIYLRMGASEQGLKDINRSIFLDPQNAWAYRNKGIHFLESGDPDEALRLFDEALRRGSFIDEVFTYMGLAHWRKGNFDQACSAWQKGIDQAEPDASDYLRTYCH